MGKFDDYINVTAPLHSATTKGKLGNANEIFTKNDEDNIQNVVDKTNEHLKKLDNRSSQMEESIKNISVTGGASVAEAVTYNNTNSGLDAVNLQAAIDALSKRGYNFKDLAKINTTPDANRLEKAFYVANTAGEYVNFLTTGENTHIITGEGLYVFTKETNSDYWKKETLIDIVQKLGSSENKVVSQKLLNSYIATLIGTSMKCDFSESVWVCKLNTSVTKSGQYIKIKVKTTPAIDTVYNGNAKDMTQPYPQIRVKNGVGEVIVGPATEDNGTVINLGYKHPSDVTTPHKAEFTVNVIDSKDEVTLKEQVQQNTENISQNTENIRKITSNLNPLIGTSMKCDFSESVWVCKLNTSVTKSGQYIKIKVKTTPAIDTVYNGNAKDMTQPYPQIRVKNGVGEVIVGPATEDNGTVINLGYKHPSDVTTPHKAEFTVNVIDSKDEVTLKEQVQQNTENIEKKSLKWLQEGILQSSTIDLMNGNFRVPGYTTIIRDWGFIGDSLSSGEMECFDGQTKKYIDMYEYSWGQQICRLCGSNGYNYSSGGQTAKGWITGDGDRTWNKAKTTKHQAYIIALGVNDSAHDVSPGNADTDVDMSNYNNNADTFAGNYAGIIQRIRSVSARSIIFVVLMPRTDSKGAAFNNVIKNIATKFTNVFIIDLSQLSELYKSDYFHNKYYMNNHLNAAGYAFTAYLFMYYIDALIQENIKSFKDIALWNTNYTANPT